MKLIYLDEAGNTGSFADPDQPLHMIGSLIIDESQVRGLQRALDELAGNYASAVTSVTGGYELAGTMMPYGSEDIEFHGSELFGGRKTSERVPPTERVDLCHSILKACRDAEVRFGSCTIDKMKLGGGHPHMRCFQFTLERLQDHLQSQEQLGLLIADEHQELEERLIKNLSSSQSSNTGWGWRPTKITNIIDTVHFVKSRHNRIVQACDVMTYFRLKGRRIHDRLLADFLSLPSFGRGSWSDHLNSPSRTTADRAVLKLHDEVCAMEIFEKTWPLR